MKSVLFSRPRHDNQTEYLYLYSRKLVKFAQQKGFKPIFDMRQKNANKNAVTNILKKRKPELIMFNGHGGPNVICGYKNELLISSEDNPEILDSSITYALACSAALELGRVTVERGAKAFIGYQFDFALGKDPNSEAAPMKDKIAPLFLEPSNILFSSLLKGNSVETAVARSKKKMKENISYLVYKNPFLEAQSLAPWLYGNYIGLIFHGDPNVSISWVLSASPINLKIKMKQNRMNPVPGVDL